ncbi:RNA-binding protein [Pyrofollis japonicus]|uniref:RNA-binding domain-containing protein n=1 Tax=Pyrofollis japonicus TaxID=3060460 RepID=UPI00295AFBCF|nr:RNA-binding domain-containing protein [Pyrofollis japonicus]BEP18499.1 RNA-binding protein [Pyrofollis japonicus]
MAFTKIVRVEIAAHAHATEDPARVEQALLNIVPEKLRPRLRIEKTVLEGHYNNPITRIVARLDGKDAEEFVKEFASMLNEQDKKILTMIVESRYDEKSGRLFLRFSKQDAYRGEIRLHDGDDVVHVVIQLRGAPKLGKAMKILQEVGLLD